MDRPSTIIRMVLIVSGLLMVMHGLAIGTPYPRGLAVPSPVIGRVLGIAVLVLELAKGISIGTAMEMAAAVT